MKKNWNITYQDTALQQSLTRDMPISSLMARILINRGISSPRQAELFLNPSLLNLHDPMLMKGMDRCVFRIREALRRKEKILVYGDYDVDGISAAALMVLVLKHIGADVDSYLPSRINIGYGLNEKSVRVIRDKKPKLLITVDCGIGALEQIEELKGLGIDVIVTDHHTPDERLPAADAIINPLQNGCAYPEKNLSGVGIVFKLASALLGAGDDWLHQQLDLVCLGTIADVVPLTGENRILVKNGLDQLANTKKCGLKALIEQSGLKARAITSYHVGFILGPRINASGRVSDPGASLDLFLAEDANRAEALAKALCAENRNRQRMEESVLRQAVTRVENSMDFKRQRVIVLDDASWHRGVIGIVASRLVDRFYRPAVIISIDGDEGRGSCRSIRGFNLFDALSGCAGHLKNFGGHGYAAGFTIAKDKLGEFRRSINDMADKMLMPQDLVPSIKVDAEIPISDLNRKTLEELDRLNPFGVGNPKPVFVSRQLMIRNMPQALRKSTIKMWVTDGKVTAEAIGFNMAQRVPDLLRQSKIDIVYTCELDTYKGITSIKLQLKDIRALPLPLIEEARNLVTDTVLSA
ncbi:MAG: single-stranded-DNA-specific exonuclease RecJ [Candidatus Omnitrophica bacterium]|nr:single-stranded-DNA-specific exonuclease RecJ [Candidatus Omnitrophota bacterium]